MVSKPSYEDLMARLAAAETTIADYRRIEEALQESLDNFRSLFTTLRDFLFVLDGAGRMVHVNPIVLQRLGYREEELVGQSVLFVHPPERRDEAAAIVADMMAGRREFCPIPLQAKDGSLIPVETIVVGGRWDGEPAIFGVSRDISERKRAEEEIQKLAAAVRHSGELVNLATLEGTMVFLNEAGGSMLGIEPLDLGQRSIMSVIPEHLQGLLQREILPALLRGDSWEGDLQYRNLQTGKIVDVHTMAFTIKDPHTGKPQLLANVSRDITDRKRAEKNLRQLRNYLANIINSMPSVLVGVDAAGRVTQWNAEAQKATGCAAAEAVGRPLSQVFPRLAPEMERVRQAMQARQVHSAVRRARREDGESRYEDVTIYPLSENGVEGAVIRIDDVTERVRLEEMMVQSEKMLSVGGLAAGMAHEINNPLAGMIQNASVLCNRLTNADLPANKRAAAKVGTTMDVISAFMAARGVPQMLNNIRTSGARAAEIVTNVLSFAGKSDSASTTHSLAELLDQSVDLAGSDYDLRKKYDFRQVRIIKEYEQNLPELPCQGAQIQQVLLNILRNGAEAMQQAAPYGDGREPHFILRLAHEKQAGRLRIEIEDNGPGMDEAVRKRIFEPFFTTKPTDRGTGLGLSVSYFIITENHGGELTVESTPGEGAKFIISLPAPAGQGDGAAGA